MTKQSPRRLFKLLLPLLVLALSGYGYRYILTHPPQAERGRSPQPPLMSVEAVSLEPRDYQIELTSFGVVRPRTESRLIPQVSGEVIEISERFRDGAFFEAGNLLLRIDPRDYQAAVEVARAELVEAELRLKEEQARADQAERDWQRLGRGPAGELVLRKPQVAASRAAIAAARARLLTAQLNLERTHIKAPYAGRILRKSVDLGQVVSPGTELAQIYAVDYVEVRLPLNSRQLEYIDLPEQYRGGELSTQTLPKVTLQAQIGRSRHTWEGRVVRVEGAIDSQSRQLFVVAQVEDPYRLSQAGNPPLKVGQFVQARIQGHLLTGVFVIPRSALGQDNRILLIEDNRLQPRQLAPLWMDDENLVVRSGLTAGDLINLTPLGAVAAGTPVQPLLDGKELATDKDAPSPKAPRKAGLQEGSERRARVPAAQGAVAAAAGGVP